jgi:hypothetical protein
VFGCGLNIQKLKQGFVKKTISNLVYTLQLLNDAIDLSGNAFGLLKIYYGHHQTFIESRAFGILSLDIKSFA